MRTYNLPKLAIAVVVIASAMSSSTVMPLTAQGQRQVPAAQALQRVLEDYGEEAERRFVRAFRHLDRVEFRELSTEFLQRRETALRRFLNKYPLATEAHRARILLAHTLLYRQSHDEAKSLLNMVILTSNDASLEYEARFTLVKLLRRTDLIQARVSLQEISGRKNATDAIKARAFYELSTLLDDALAVPVLKQGATLKDNRFQRQCRKRLTKITVVASGLTKPSRVARPFETRSVAGKMISSAALNDRVYLIHFWTRNAADDGAIRTYLGALQLNHEGRGLVVIGVNTDGDVEKLRAAQAAGKFPWTEVGDKWGELSALALAYAPVTVPFTVLVDGSGTIRHADRVIVPETATKYAATDLWKATAVAVRAPRTN